MTKGILKIRVNMIIIGVILICLGIIITGAWTNFAYPGDIERLHNVLVGSIIGYSFSVIVLLRCKKVNAMGRSPTMDATCWFRLLIPAPRSLIQFSTRSSRPSKRASICASRDPKRHAAPTKAKRRTMPTPTTEIIICSELSIFGYSFTSDHSISRSGPPPRSTTAR